MFLLYLYQTGGRKWRTVPGWTKGIKMNERGDERQIQRNRVWRKFDEQ